MYWNTEALLNFVVVRLQPFDAVASAVRDDNNMSATEALEFGLIDNIGHPPKGSDSRKQQQPQVKGTTSAMPSAAPQTQQAM